MHILDTNFNTVEGGEFHDIGDTSEHPETTEEDLLIDANVDVDVTRQARRTFTATLLNPDGIFSPGSTFGGLFYVDRMVLLYRGIDYGDSKELIPVGTFMIDHADINAERGMSILVLSGTDLWKKLLKSQFTAPYSWASGTNINTVISALAASAGVTKLNLDPLSERVTSAKQLSKVLAVERGDNRGDVLRALCDSYGIDVYFDPLGTLTTQDFQTPEDTSVVWTYDSTSSNNLVTVQSAITDEKLYNTIMVIGTADKTNTVVSVKKNNDPRSATNVTRIGERVLKYESDQIGTQAVADAVANRLFYQNVIVSDDITLETVCNPAFEGNDVIRVVEAEFTKLNGTYRMKAFTVPMSTSRQTIRLQANLSLATS